LKLHKALKKRGLNPGNIVEWFVDTIETGATKIPEIRKQYTKVKDELEAIDYKKAISKYELENLNNHIAILRDIYNKRNEISNLNAGVQLLQGHIHRLESDNPQLQQQKIGK